MMHLKDCDYLINALFTVPTTMLSSWFTTRMLSFRHPWRYFLVYTLVSTGIKMVGRPLNGMLELIEILLLFGMVLLMSDDRFIYRLFVPALLLAIMFVGEVCGLTLFSSLGIRIDTGVYQHLRDNFSTVVFVRMVVLALLTALYYFIEQVWKRATKKNGPNDLLAFTIFPLNQGLLLWYGTILARKAGGHPQDFLRLSGLTVISLCADLVMLLALKRLRAADEARRKAEYLETQMRQQALYYDHVIHDAETTAMVRHDMRNQLNAVYSLLDSGDRHNAEAIVDSLSTMIASPQKFCDNRVVNIVMNEKAESCRSAGIRLICDLSVNAATISGAELCSLFSNVMDNAISGCRNSGAAEPFIHISAQEQKGYLSLRCVNSAQAPKEASKRHSLHSEHGWGLVILEEIAARRDGKLETEMTAEGFEIRIFLKCALSQANAVPVAP